jgi:DNA helicase-2/ATP-dependent DNA helicase PcrA
LRSARLSGEELGRSLQSLNDLKAIKYAEIISSSRFHHEQSPYATKHGVKGAEFDDVLVVVGREWNMYNFAQMLDLSCQSRALSMKESQAYVRNRNLFYVACSRARNRLAILFTQELTTQGLATLDNWFGAEQVVGLNFTC